MVRSTDSVRITFPYIDWKNDLHLYWAKFNIELIWILNHNSIYSMILYYWYFNFKKYSTHDFMSLISLSQPFFRHLSLKSSWNMYLDLIVFHRTHRVIQASTDVRGRATRPNIHVDNGPKIDEFGRWTKIIILRWTSRRIFDDGTSTSWTNLNRWPYKFIIDRRLDR